jgi:hypothetical protein
MTQDSFDALSARGAAASPNDSQRTPRGFLRLLPRAPFPFTLYIWADGCFWLYVRTAAVTPCRRPPT